MKSCFLLLLVLGVLHCSLAADLSRAVDIVNDSGHKLQVYWVRPENGEAVPYSAINSGAEAMINSYVNHTFMIRDETDDCGGDENCHVNYVTVTEENKRQRKYKHGVSHNELFMS